MTDTNMTDPVTMQEGTGTIVAGTTMSGGNQVNVEPVLASNDPELNPGNEVGSGSIAAEQQIYSVSQVAGGVDPM